MARTKIEWAEAVWNPVTGCTKVSQGCKHCYAERMAKRLAGRCGYPAAPYQFDVTLHPEKLYEPEAWRKPRCIFVCSMADLFHEQVPGDFIRRVWDVMLASKQHTFMVLTKRPQRALCWMTDSNISIVPPWIWFGVSAETQAMANERIPWLLAIPAIVRFVSVEPMLGPINIEEVPGVYSMGKQLDWVICGGESGPGARPMRPDWARGLRDECKAAMVPFFFKQWGEWFPEDQWTRDQEIELCKIEGIWLDRERWHYWDDGTASIRHKYGAGRLLDGVIHDALPIR